MLIDVLAGRDSGSAAVWGSYHFAQAPQPGEEVEIDGTVVVVSRAWHRPSPYYKGAKFAILVGDPVGGSDARSQVRGDAGAVVRADAT
jgi:hypothetical protein